jgi:putative transposase
LQERLRNRLRELAATHVRYGYRRLTVLLRREGWNVNAKRVYRLYDEENLKVRSVERKKSRAGSACRKSMLRSRTIAGRRISSATS